MDSVSQQLLMSGGQSIVPTDPYFSQVSLLLHGDGTNGAQNNTFLDSSSNNIPLTRGGNATQGSVGPYGTNWSTFFDGSTGYVSAPANAAYAFGTGDFTIEMWMLNHSFPESSITNRTSSVSVGCWRLVIGSLGGMLFGELTGTDTGAVTANGLLVAGRWHHIAVSRTSGTLRIFLDGAVVATRASYTNNFNSSSFPLLIGRRAPDEAGYFNANISNLRIVKGTAIYTSSFTVPKEPLTAVAGTSLLCFQNNRFKDNSANNFTLTGLGGARVIRSGPYPNTSYTPLGNQGSGYFDGTGDVITTPRNSAMAVGTGDFTVEMWVYWSGTGDAYQSIVGSRTLTTNDSFAYTVGCSAGNVYFYSNQFNLATSGALVIPNAWTHIAVTRSAGTGKIYVNGEMKTSGPLTNDFSSDTIAVGSIHTGEQAFSGYISNLRLVKGTSVYASNFTPPTSPVTAIPGTTLLLNFSNAGIYDSSAKITLDTLGSTQISTIEKKYGTGSIYFNGNASMTASGSPNFVFETDYTIEMWVYIISGDFTLVDNTGSGGNFQISRFDGSIYHGGAGPWSVTFPSNQWFHLCFSRSGSTLRGFKDGVLFGTKTVTAVVGSTSHFTVGKRNDNLYLFNGYIDELRITKGVARYTANFTPPAGPFPDQ